MKLIQPFLIVVFAGFAMLYLARFRTRLVDRIVVLIGVTLGIVMVIFPDLSDVLARFFGVGRGPDLFSYLGLTGLAFIVLLLYSRVRQLRAQITDLTRALSLSQAREPAAKASREGSLDSSPQGEDSHAKSRDT